MLLEVDHLSKSYPKINSSASRLSLLYQALLNKPYKSRFDVLKDISFTLKRGESIGIIGENGAGKSTLLKLIAGVLQPSSGHVHCHGKVSALLELGAGFHPDYSGLDNIRMNATLSGLSVQELNARIDAIIEFADIGDYIHEPIKHYSSGMVVRLGFAMMTALRPELLITDEVLAVGDEAFQKKCIHWIEQYLSTGGSILLCSHGMYHIQKLCQKAIWIERGECRMYGDSNTVTAAYLAYQEKKENKDKALQVSADQSSDQQATYRIKSARLSDANGEAFEVLAHGDTLKVSGLVYSPDNRPPVVCIGLNRMNGLPIMGVTSAMDAIELKQVDDHLFAFTLVYPNLSLFAGEYIVNCHAMDPEAMRLFDTYELCFTLRCERITLGTLKIPYHWDV